MHHRSTPGRRRAPKPSWRAEIRSLVNPTLAVKSLVALGIVGATTGAVIVPSTSGASTSLAMAPTASTLVADARVAAVAGTSRTTARTALGTPVAAAGAESASTETAGAETAGAETAGAAAAETAAPGVQDAAVISPSATGPLAGIQAGVIGISAVAKPAEEVNLDAQGDSGAAGSQSAAGGATNAAGATGYSTSAYAGMCRGLGLGGSASAVCSAVRSLFGPLSIGGYRAGDSGDHGAGKAADIMVDNFAEGDAIAAFVMAHAGELNVKYVIWKQRIWHPGGGWKAMADRGSPTQNHYDHVHVSVN